MKPSHKEAIRKLLIEHPDGLTGQSIAQRLGVTAKVVKRCIDLSMPDCYIDRWAPGKRGQYLAVYRRADIPANCPHPDDRFKTVETQWRTRSAASMERMAA